jgi:hypothetical protein
MTGAMVGSTSSKQPPGTVRKIVALKSSLVAVTVRVVTVSLCLAVLSGCAGNSNYLYGQDGAPARWHEYVNPRPSRNAIETAVIEVAQSRKNSRVSNSDILFIIDDETKKQAVHCVDVVDSPPSGNGSSEKTVTRYRVIDGLISAMSDPSEEYFIDAELERTILLAVARTWTPDPVINYNDHGHNMTIHSVGIDNCTANVKIFDGDAVGGRPIAQKLVFFCFTR